MTETRRRALEDAAVRALRLYPRAKGLRTAYRNGAACALDRGSIDSCPYAHDPHKTWRLAYRQAWLGGYRSVEFDAE